MTSSPGSSQSQARHPLVLTPPVERFLSRRNYAPLSLLLATLLLALIGSAQAATYNSDGSLADVIAKVALASDGDTVTLPAGTFTWTSVLTITKAITLQGLGTVTTDDGGRATDCGTVIVCDSAQVIKFAGGADKAQRMTGIKFEHGTAPASYLVELNGGTSNIDGRTMRLDHCVFENASPAGGLTVGAFDIIGVLDHCTFHVTTSNVIPIYIFHMNWNIPGASYAGGSWADSSHFGTSKFFFIEDNNFNFDGVTYAAIDGSRGSRVVFRYNTLDHGSCEIHGSEQGVIRGGRAYEFYNNTFINNFGLLINCRSAVVLAHDNTVVGGMPDPQIYLDDYRDAYSTAVFGVSDGTSPWDVNDTADYTGNGLGGGPNGQKASGTATGGGTDPGYYNWLTVTVAGSPWTPDQFAGYSIRKTSTNPALQKGSYIGTNSSNTITYKHPASGTEMIFTAGDTFAIHKVIHSMDQPGRGEGSLVPQVALPTPPSGWNNQITDPCYEWNNGTSHFFPQVKFIREGEHFFNNTPKPGYTPYTYPHPLVSGGHDGPGAPQDLHVTP